MRGGLAAEAPGRVGVRYRSITAEGASSRPWRGRVFTGHDFLGRSGPPSAFDLVKPEPAKERRRTPTVQRARAGPLRLLDSFDDHAAFILGRRGDVLATSHLCRVLLADFDVMPYRAPTSPAGSSSPLRHASCMWTARRKPEDRTAYPSTATRPPGSGN
ncbi:MmyB family transcriptional regulator [Streptomyces mirabilis]|uniref:MmyB family transcriptional regulator n=1 Tax=Streptomyces mirabilis TaxID=68239 RepID=UPI0036646979